MDVSKIPILGLAAALSTTLASSDAGLNSIKPASLDKARELGVELCKYVDESGNVQSALCESFDDKKFDYLIGLNPQSQSLEIFSVREVGDEVKGPEIDLANQYYDGKLDSDFISGFSVEKEYNTMNSAKQAKLMIEANAKKDKSNCFEFAINSEDPLPSNPGDTKLTTNHGRKFGLEQTREQFKQELIQGLKEDGLIQVDNPNTKKAGYYPIALYIHYEEPVERVVQITDEITDTYNYYENAPPDYHFIRKDKEGGFSHKLGWDKLPEKLDVKEFPQNLKVDGYVAEKKIALDYQHVAYFLVPDQPLDPGHDTYVDNHNDTCEALSNISYETLSVESSLRLLNSVNKDTQQRIKDC